MQDDIKQIMERVPTVARLYYSGTPGRRYRRASVMNGPGDPLVHRSHAEQEIRRLLAVLADREGRQQWISVDDRLPEWAMRDDTPCQLQGKPIGAHLKSQMVLVTLDSGAVRMDRLEGIEGSGAPFWQTYRQRVVAWMPPPQPADAQRAKEPT